MRLARFTILSGLVLLVLHGAPAGSSAAADKANAANDPIATPLSPMSHDQWKQLNITSGADNPLNVLPTPNKDNYRGAENDPWMIDEAVAANPPYGVQPGATVEIFSYSAAAIRSSDAKVCALGTGGGRRTSALGCLASAYQAKILAIARNVYIHKD